MLFNKNHGHGQLQSYITVGALIVLAPGLLTWSWNKIAAGLLAFPPSKYVHGFALLVGMTVIILMFQIISSLFRRQHDQARQKL